MREDAHVALREDERKQLGGHLGMDDHLCAARARGSKGEGDGHDEAMVRQHRHARVVDRLLEAAHVRPVREVGRGGDDHAQAHVAPPQRVVCPKGGELIERVAPIAGRAKADRQGGAQDGERDAADHAPRDDGVIDKLVVDDIGDKLNRLERRKNGGRRKREGREVEQGEADEYHEANDPTATLARLQPIEHGQLLQPGRLDVLADVDANGSEDAHDDADGQTKLGQLAALGAAAGHGEVAHAGRHEPRRRVRFISDLYSGGGTEELGMWATPREHRGEKRACAILNGRTREHKKTV